jgi:hypothetical protein
MYLVEKQDHWCLGEPLLSEGKGKRRRRVSGCSIVRRAEKRRNKQNCRSSRRAWELLAFDSEERKRGGSQSDSVSMSPRPTEREKGKEEDKRTESLSSTRHWSYPETATRKRIAVTFSKQLMQGKV